MTRFATVVMAALVFGLCSQLQAHHSDEAVYRVQAETDVKGLVSQIQIRNPHSWIFLDVKGENGETQRWGGEWRAATQLQREGIATNTLRVGEEVVIHGRPPRNPKDLRVLVLTVTRTSDGKVFGAQRDRAAQ